MRPLAAFLALFGTLLVVTTARASTDPTQMCRAAIARAEQEANIPAGLLQAIGRVESGRRNPETGQVGPWPWTINAEGRGHFFPDRAAAVTAVRELQGRGVRVIDVGCMQINLHFHPRAFETLEQAFDPWANARYAAQFLTQLHAARNDWMVAAGHYHSHTPDLAEAYRGRVRNAWPEAERRVVEDRALGARLAGMPAAPAPPAALSLSNREDRAQVIASSGAAGRGLDAYRANPVPLASRAFLSPGRAPGPGTLLRR